MKWLPMPKESHMKIDKFIIAIVAVIIFAYFFPQFAADEGTIPLDQIGKIGIALIFFFYGLKMAPEKLRAGLSNWKLHILVQSATFIFFPLLVIALYPAAVTEHYRILWLGLFFLAIMPSTVSSSVVMVSIARGNVPAAIFNASISGIIGIIAAPLWLSIFIASEPGSHTDFSTIYTSLAFEIILPVILGLALQRFLGGYAQRYSSQLTTFDKAVILLIIYKSFAHSFEARIFSTVSVADLALITAAVIALFFIAYYSTAFLSKLFGFSFEDRITAQFCGTKKSLVHGTVFSGILFPGSASVGLILLPLMIFHAIQILLISFIASKYESEREDV